MFKKWINLFIVLFLVHSMGCGAQNNTASSSMDSVDRTTLSKPLDVAVDPIANEIFIANNMDNSLVAFERTDQGNATPKRIIKGSTTTINWPFDVVLDPVHHEVIVANQLSNVLLGFSMTSNADVSPLWHQFLYSDIFSVDTGGFGISLEKNLLVVLDTIIDTLVAYPLTGTGTLNYEHKLVITAFYDKGRAADIAIDNVNKNIFVLFSRAIAVYPLDFIETTQPLRTITSIDISSGAKIAIDTINDEIAITNQDGNSIIFLPLSASGDVHAIRKIAGAATLLNKPFGVAIDPINNEVFVTNINNNSVTVYSRTDDGNTSPLRIIKGPDSN